MHLPGQTGKDFCPTIRNHRLNKRILIREKVELRIEQERREF
jgi:hypothetical protein